MPQLRPNSGGTDERGVTIPRGTLIHVAGPPFETNHDTPVDGHPENLAMALSTFKEARAFEHVLESAAGPNVFARLVEKWSDAARAAAAAARRAKSKGGNWRRAAWQTYATASGQAKIGGRGRAGSKGQGFDKWAEQRADMQADTRAGSSRSMAKFGDRHNAIVNTRKQGILDRMRGRDTAAARANASAGFKGGSFQRMMDAPMKTGRSGETYGGNTYSPKAGFRRGSLARSEKRGKAKGYASAPWYRSKRSA